MSIRKVAEGALSSLEVDDKGITRLKDDCPKWIKDMVYDCHEGSLPSNYIYDTIREILEDITAIGDWGYTNDEIIDEVRSELEPDVYTYDLNEWAKEFPEYVDDMMKEETFDNHDSLLMAAQLKHKEYLCDTIGAWLSDEDGEEYAEEDDEDDG